MALSKVPEPEMTELTRHYRVIGPIIGHTSVLSLDGNAIILKNSKCCN